MGVHYLDIWLNDVLCLLALQVAASASLVILMLKVKVSNRITTSANPYKGDQEQWKVRTCETCPEIPIVLPGSFSTEISCRRTSQRLTVFSSMDRFELTGHTQKSSPRVVHLNTTGVELAACFLWTGSQDNLSNIFD